MYSSLRVLSRSGRHVPSTGTWWAVFPPPPNLTQSPALLHPPLAVPHYTAPPVTASGAGAASFPKKAGLVRVCSLLRCFVVPAAGSCPGCFTPPPSTPPRTTSLHLTSPPLLFFFSMPSPSI